jgi:hypothetical protein
MNAGHEHPGSDAMSWHGLPRRLDIADAQRIRDALAALWQTQTSVRSKRTPQADLGVWFDPLARGARLRADLAKLAAADPAIRADAGLLGAPFIVDVGEGRLLASPEGRALLIVLGRLLEAAEPDQQTIQLTWAITDRADAKLLELYRGWSRQRLDSVIALRRGQAAPMLPAAVGQVLFLLVNGNIGAERALHRPPQDGVRAEADAALADIAGAFEKALELPNGAQRSGGAYSLYGGYGLTEARRRLGDDLTTDPVYLADGSRERVLLRLGSELARRPGLEENTIEKAITRLVQAYSRRRPVLASYGLARGAPGTGKEITNMLLAAFRRARSPGAAASPADG